MHQADTFGRAIMKSYGSYEMERDSTNDGLFTGTREIPSAWCRDL